MTEHEKLLSSLIEIKSYSGEEKDIRGYIKKWFKERKIDSFRQDENLIVHFEGADRSKAFIFNSHMDTVNRGDAAWEYGPWKPTKVGNTLVGLGASDMKSGLTASMILAEKYSNEKPPVDLWFTYVTREEVDGSGTDSFARWFSQNKYNIQYKDKAGIFTEPTGLKEIEHGHRGNLFLIAQAEGESGHSSRPGDIKGTLAVKQMFNFSQSFQEQVKLWNEKYQSKYFNPAITLGELTSIQAGVNVVTKNGLPVIVPASPNKFPSLCVATFDLRTTPEFHAAALKKVEDLAKKEGIKVDLLYPEAPAGFTDPQEKIIEITKSKVPDAILKVSQGSADLGFLTGLGIKAIIFGPGEKLQAHKTNEYCYPVKIPQAVDLYQAIVESWAK